MATTSLGWLTLDLVARTAGFTDGMDKAERSADKWRKNVERNTKIATTALAAAASAMRARICVQALPLLILAYLSETAKAEIGETKGLCCRDWR